MQKTARIWTDDEQVIVNLNDVGELESAMRFKAANIKAKADPELFDAVADVLNDLWNEAMGLSIELGALKKMKRGAHQGHKCKECKWLDMRYKTTVGYECRCPNIRHSRMGHLKQPSNPACAKGFEAR